MRRFNWTDPSRGDWMPAWLILATGIAAAVPIVVDGVIAAIQVLRYA
jgi:hypothetical protein